MPLYEFRCEKCKDKFEQLVSAVDAEVACPKCGSKKVKKLFSVFGFVSGERKVFSSKGCDTCSASPSSCATCKSS